MIDKVSKKIKKIRRFINASVQHHPIAKRRKSKAISRYLLNHLGFNNQQKIVDWFHQLKYYYQKGDASFSGNYYFGLAEWQESVFILKYLQPDDLFLDIGANHGHYTLLASGFSGCHSIAIEPVLQSYNQLLKNISLNQLSPLVHTYNIGLSDQDDTLHFSTDKGTMNKIVEAHYPNKVSVPVQTLDSLHIKPNLIKIDVEGFEYDVFMGGKETLALDEVNVVICEINFTLRHGVTGKDIVDYLASFHFLPYAFNGKKLIRLKEFNTETYNTIFIKNIDLANERLAIKKSISIWGVELG